MHTLKLLPTVANFRTARSPAVLVTFLIMLAIVPSSYASVILEVTNGYLMGAKSVNVDGTLYDVSFLDGSCDSLFDNCNPANFTFTNEATARDAAQALLDQVFVNTPGVGNFDDYPALTNGCIVYPNPVASHSLCAARIPYSLQTRALAVAQANNRWVYNNDFTNTTLFDRSQSTAGFTLGTYALFAPVGAPPPPPPPGVPAPSTLALLGLGIAGIRYQRRRRLTA